MGFVRCVRLQTQDEWIVEWIVEAKLPCTVVWTVGTVGQCWAIKWFNPKLHDVNLWLLF